MAWTVEILPKALKALAKVTLRERLRIAAQIDRLEEGPCPEGAKKLKGRPERDLYRLRSGDYRILYQAEEARLVVLVVRVAHRREAYR